LESLNSAEIMEIIALLEASIDMQFQIWLTVTFAYIASTYLSREELPKSVLYSGTVLYICIVLALYFRWIADGIRAQSLISELAIREIAFDASDYAFIFRLLTFAVGSILAIVLALYFNLKMGKSSKLTKGT
jgi:hypothetical protein